jgi:hypothetical protein
MTKYLNNTMVYNWPERERNEIVRLRTGSVHHEVLREILFIFRGDKERDFLPKFARMARLSIW